MMMISSKAGQRLAKATAEFFEAKAELTGNYSADAEERMRLAALDMDLAGFDLGRELMGDNHHLVEGD